MTYLLSRICSSCSRKFTRKVNATEKWPDKCDRCRSEGK